jgi:hypothetical protein
VKHLTISIESISETEGRWLLRCSCGRLFVGYNNRADAELDHKLHIIKEWQRENPE